MNILSERIIKNIFIREKPSYSEGLTIIWHRAIFPGFDWPSIVTAARLNCCVRQGNRCFPSAMGTNINPARLATAETHIDVYGPTINLSYVNNNRLFQKIIIMTNTNS